MLTRQSTRTPKYCHHKATGQGYVRLNDKVYYCGAFADPKSKEMYWSLVRQWLSQRRQLIERSEPGAGSGGPTIAQIMSGYLEYAAKYYRHKDGTPTGEYNNIREAMRSPKALYLSLPAADFSPLKLQAVRQELIAMRMARSNINKHIGRIKRLFRWAVSQEMVSGEVLHALDSVGGLHRGHSDAMETDPIKPVPTAHIDAVIRQLSPSLAKLKAIYETREQQPVWPGPRLTGSSQDAELEQLTLKLPEESAVATMIELQRSTGMRPGEVCSLRTGDLVMDGTVWVYRPRGHKTEHHGIEKEIAIGPRAQLILRPFLL